MAWKYVIVRAGNQEVPVIFPDNLVHSLMADAMRHYFTKMAFEMSNKQLSVTALNDMYASIKAVAAGDITIDVGIASGKSESLGVESRDVDTNWIKSYVYHHGIAEEDVPSAD